LILVREPNVRKQRRRRSGAQPVNAFDFANGFIAVLSPTSFSAGPSSSRLDGVGHSLI